MSSAIGFIGLGVMGEPICRNLARKSGLPVTGFDQSDGPLERLAGDGVDRAPSLAELARRCDVIFMALPSGKHVQAVCEGTNGLLSHVSPRHTVVDLGTSPIEVTRELAGRFAAIGADYADAPIARTRQAAEDGTLSVMVGASEAVFSRLQPLISNFATDITHCGPAGSGQIVKILNNMVLMETVVALSEALETARRAGLEGKVLFETLAKGSADSFALRNHGLKAIAARQFPERAFSAEYMLKDISYALEMAADGNIDAQEAALGARLLQRAIDDGFGAEYWPAIVKVIEK